MEGRKWTLRPERSASGMRIVSVDEDDTEIWVKGNAARLRLNGVDLPECRRKAETAVPRGWQRAGLAAGHRAQGMELLTEGGGLRAFASGPLVMDAPGQRSYQGMTAGGEMVARCSIASAPIP